MDCRRYRRNSVFTESASLALSDSAQFRKGLRAFLMRNMRFFCGMSEIAASASLTDQSSSCLVELPEKWICTVHLSSCGVHTLRSFLRIHFP